MEASDFVTLFMDKFEQAKDIAELDAIVQEIKEWQDLLACYYQSNKERLTNKSNPEDFLKRGPHG